MLEFAYATGMRVTEIINLNLEDVNLKEGYNGDISSRDAGRIGGNMVKKMIQQVENNMK